MSTKDSAQQYLQNEQQFGEPNDIGSTDDDVVEIAAERFARLFLEQCLNNRDQKKQDDSIQ